MAVFLWRRSPGASAPARGVWIWEKTFRLDDEARFGGGRSQRREIYCEFVADDQVA